MSLSVLDEIMCFPLKQISTRGGKVLHGIKSDDEGFVSFGEAYFSSIDYGVVRAWKKHSRMVSNLIVPYGQVLFVFFDPSIERYREELVGGNRYIRLTVPSNIWFGFMGAGQGENIIFNCANISHDDAEVEVREKQAFDYHWKVPEKRIG